MADLQEDLNFGIKLDYPDNNNQQKPPAKEQVKLPSNRDSNSTEAAVGGQIASNNYDLSNAAHPTACIFTFAFKAAAIIMYLVIGSFISDIMTFIFVIVLSSLDFWVVKNVTGRLLVGLRWWSESDNEGKQIWKFESHDHERKTNRVDKAFFWSSQLIGTAVWAILFILKVLSLNIFWSLLLFVNTCLCGTNLYGYYQCRGEHQKKLSQLKSAGLKHLAGRFI